MVYRRVPVNLHYQGLTEESWAWIKKRVPVLAVEDSCAIVAVKVGGIYAGACVFDTWTKNSVTCTFVIDNPMVLRTGFLNLCCSYALEVEGRQKVFVQLASNNEKSLKFVDHIGFIEQHRLKDVYGDGIDNVILELTKETCNYLLDEVA